MKNSYQTFILASVIWVSITAAMQITSKEKERFLPLSTKSDQARADYQKAIERIANADSKQYMELINKAITEDPMFFMAHAHIALNSFMGEKPKDNAKEKLEAVLSLPQERLTPAEKIIRNVLVKIQEDPKSDLTPLTDELVSKYPNNIEAYETAIAISDFLEKDKETAFRYGQKLVEVAPDEGHVYNFMGYYYMEKGQMDKAKQAFENYVRLSPKEANAFDSMGDYYMKAEQYDQAAASFDRAIAMGMEISRERAEKARALARGENPDDIKEDATEQK